MVTCAPLQLRPAAGCHRAMNLRWRGTGCSAVQTKGLSAVKSRPAHSVPSFLRFYKVHGHQTCWNMLKHGWKELQKQLQAKAPWHARSLCSTSLKPALDVSSTGKNQQQTSTRVALRTPSASNHPWNPWNKMEKVCINVPITGSFTRNMVVNGSDM